MAFLDHPVFRSAACLVFFLDPVVAEPAYLLVKERAFMMNLNVFQLCSLYGKPRIPPLIRVEDVLLSESPSVRFLLADREIESLENGKGKKNGRLQGEDVV